MENTQSVHQSHGVQGSSKSKSESPDGYQKTDAQFKGDVADSLSLHSLSSTQTLDTSPDVPLQKELHIHDVSQSSVSVNPVSLESIRQELCVSDSDWILVSARASLESSSDEKALMTHFFESKQKKRSALGRFFMSPFDRRHARKMTKKAMVAHIDRALEKIQERLNPPAKKAEPQSSSIQMDEMRDEIRQLKQEKEMDLNTIQSYETQVAGLSRKIADLNSEKIRSEAGASNDVTALQSQLAVMTDALSLAKARESDLVQIASELKEQNDFFRQTESHEPIVEKTPPKPLESAASPEDERIHLDESGSYEARFRHSESQRLKMEEEITKERGDFETVLKERDTKIQDLLRDMNAMKDLDDSKIGRLKDLVTDMFETAMQESMTMDDFREQFKTHLK